LRKPILIAIIAAIIFALAVFLLLQGQEATRTVVVTVQDMPVGTVVDESMLRTIDVPVGSAIGADVMVDFVEIVGKTVVLARAEGDLIPLTALGDARLTPAEGNGFITVTVPSQDAKALMVDDLVAFSVFEHGAGAEMVEGFIVRAVSTDERAAYLLVEGHRENILYLSSFLATQSYILVRKAGN